jgi:hypothetical protein
MNTKEKTLKTRTEHGLNPKTIMRRIVIIQPQLRRGGGGGSLQAASIKDPMADKEDGTRNNSNQC